MQAHQEKKARQLEERVRQADLERKQRAAEGLKEEELRRTRLELQNREDENRSLQGSLHQASKQLAKEKRTREEVEKVIRDLKSMSLRGERLHTLLSSNVDAIGSWN